MRRTRGGSYGLTATDADGDTATGTVTINVDAECEFSSTTPSLTYAPGDSVNYQLPAASCPDNPVTYSLSGAPSWISFAASSRRISGTVPASAVGNYAMTLTARDADGDTDTLAVTLYVDAEPVLPDATYSFNDAASVDVTLPAATKGNPSFTYSLSPPPPGLTFTAGTRALSGTVDRHTAGTYTYSVTDADGDAATSTVTIRVWCGLTVRSAGNGTVSGSGSYECDTVVWFTATPNAHYCFDEWDGVFDPRSADERRGPACHAGGRFNITIVKNVTYTASFEIRQYTLTVNLGAGSGDYDALTRQAISAPAGRCILGMTSTFSHWTGDTVADADSRNTTVYMDGDKTVTASYDVTTVPCSRDDPSNEDEEDETGAPAGPEGG